jgi:hypothetical protein
MLLFGAILCCAGDKIISTSPFDEGMPVTIEVTAGKHFIHDMKIGKFLTIHNPPTTAFWIENPDGEYIETLFVTKKVGGEKWRATPGEEPVGDDLRRKGSLPTWAQRRGIVYPDGLYLPTKEDPMPDAVTSASPKASYSIVTTVPKDLTHFFIFAEFNNSTDFNDYYRSDLAPGDAGYSGNWFTGGQPAVVYAAEIDLSGGEKAFEMELVGHSSPDGSDGDVYKDLSHLTTGTGIIEKIVIYVE